MAAHLIVVEHQSHAGGGKLVNATLACVSAAAKVGGDVHAIVLGQAVGDIAKQMAPFVKKVHLAEHAGLKDRLAQPWAKAAVARSAMLSLPSGAGA